MTLDEYRKDCERTDMKGLDFTNRLNMYSHGLTGEAGEFTELTKKTVYHAHAFNRNSFAEELGDLFFYLDRAANLIGMDLSEIMERNVAKRAKRYPNGFTSEDSQKRVDVVAETETILGSEPCEVCRYFDCKCPKPENNWKPETEAVYKRMRAGGLKLPPCNCGSLGCEDCFP